MLEKKKIEKQKYFPKNISQILATETRSLE